MFQNPRRGLAVSVTAVCMAAFAWPARAQDAPAVRVPNASVTREIRGQLGASVNNLGLQHTLDIVWTKPASSSAHPLFSGAHLAVAVSSAVTPALARVGGWIEYAPLSIVTVRAGLEPAAYFGTFNALKSIDGYDAPFDGDTLGAMDGEPGRGLRAYVTPSLQARVGPIAARVSADVEHWRAWTDGRVFYEPTRDTVVRSRGDWLLNASAVATYQHDFEHGGFASAGVLFATVRVFDAPQNEVRRLGGVAIREFARPHLGLPHLRLTALVWRYLEDPWKRGEWGAAAAIGYRFGA